MTDSSQRNYKGFTPRLGIYRVLHHRSGRMVLGYSAHLTGTLNRIRFELELGGCRNPQLQQDWKADGPDGFTFEVLDELSPPKSAADPTADLKELLALWRDKLQLRPESEY